MLAISTGGIGPMDISQGTKASGVSKEEEKAMEAFASLMDMVSTRQDGTGYEDMETGDVDSIITDKSGGSEYESYMKENSIKSHKYEDNTSTAKTDSHTRDKDVKTFDVKDADAAIETAAEVMSDVKDMLKEELGISDEELEKLLSDMGISLQDLLVGNNLKDFILQFSGATEVDLLINEDVATLLNDINSKLNDILQKFGVEDAQSFAQFVNENQLQVTENMTKDMSVNTMVDENVTMDEQSDIITDTDSEQTSNKVNGDVSVTENSDQTLESKITTQSANEGSRHNQGSDANAQIATNLSQAIDNVTSAGTIDSTAFVDAVQEADIIRQIIDQIKVTVSKDVKSMELQLNPEQLGKVQINVVSEEGVMHTRIIAETEAAKQAIENNIAILKEAFNNNELKVESIEVMVATYGFFRQTQDGQYEGEQGSKDTMRAGSINISELDEDMELTEEEELQVEIMKSQGNSVSYLA